MTTTAIRHTYRDISGVWRRVLAERMVDHDARGGREKDQQDGIDLAGRGDDAEAEDRPAPAVDEALALVRGGEHEQQGRRSDHADDDGFHARHGSRQDGIALQAQEEACQDEHDRQRRQADGEGGDRRAEDAEERVVARLRPDRVAHVGRRVDGDGAGGHLAHGHDIRKFGVGHPRVADDHLVLDQRQHGVAAAESEEPDLEVR